MHKVTELVNMKTNGSVSPEAFVKIIENLERDFHLKQVGFIDSELLYDEKTDIWIMIQHWESEEVLKDSSARMFKDDTTKAFRDALDPKAITINFYPSLSSWSKSSAL